MDHLNISDYSYHLPEDRIALHPLPNRDDARLLVYSAGGIKHSRFSQIPDFIDGNSILFFNDTRVIPARLLFRKGTGAVIEIMLLSPHNPPLTQTSMSAQGSCSWHCLIGNQKRWSHGLTLEKKSVALELTATLTDAEEGIVEFNWSPPGMTFAEVLHMLGDTPLPPYIKRDATAADIDRYQTVYAHHRGAVAAPTAGLHFTDAVLNALRRKGVESDFVTLHVSAGTFLPVKHENALEHTMHEEQVIISRDNVKHLLSGKKVVAVGTTTLRTLESLYWYGCKLASDPSTEFIIGQDEPYQSKKIVSLSQSVQNVLVRMGSSESLNGRTSIFIRPGYNFMVCDTLITNFHQPGSTLLLLVAAFAGQNWKSIYDEALTNGYRFLSYGDSSVLFRQT